MGEINNCILPDELYYWVQNNVWVRVMEDRTVQCGMTDIAQTMAGTLIHCRPRQVGKEIKKAKSLATVESGKWVGPVKSPIAGTVVQANSEVEADPTILNRSTYTDGWLVRLQPVDLDTDLADLVWGQEAIDGFRAYMEDKSSGDCVHCEGFTG